MTEQKLIFKTEAAEIVLIHLMLYLFFGFFFNQFLSLILDSKINT